MRWRFIAVKKSIAVAALVSALAFGEEDPRAKEARRRQTEPRPEVMAAAAAAGAAIGAAIAKEDRTKGAMLGAAVGGLAGLIFDQILKKKDSEQAEKRVETF
jgi:hypothetical protein